MHLKFNKWVVQDAILRSDEPHPEVGEKAKGACRKAHELDPTASTMNSDQPASTGKYASKMPRWKRTLHFDHEALGPFTNIYVCVFVCLFCFLFVFLCCICC